MSLFIPVYNEEESVRKNIEKIYELLNKRTDKFELVVVDDGSKDDTQNILKGMTKKMKKLRVMCFENGPSRRENLAVALKSAKYDFIGFMDLDLSVPLDYIGPVFSELKKGADIVIGSRRIQGAEVERSTYRKVWSTLYHKTIKTMFNSKIKDYQCGFKFFNKQVLLELIDLTGYDKNFQRGWFWDAELLITAEKKGFKIIEIPVRWKEGEKSSFNVKRELKVLPYILKLRMRMFYN
jgi:glycosyltransferase involved in cell wall biosynthesis